MHKVFSNNSGMSLIEIMIASSVATLSILAFMTAMNHNAQITTAMRGYQKWNALISSLGMAIEDRDYCTSLFAGLSFDDTNHDNNIEMTEITASGNTLISTLGFIDGLIANTIELRPDPYFTPVDSTELPGQKIVKVYLSMTARRYTMPKTLPSSDPSGGPTPIPTWTEATLFTGISPRHATTISFYVFANGTISSCAGKSRNAGIPTGAIAAFNTSCPSGWTSNVLNADGRALLARPTASTIPTGSGLTSVALNSQGNNGWTNPGKSLQYQFSNTISDISNFPSHGHGSANHSHAGQSHQHYTSHQHIRGTLGGSSAPCCSNNYIVTGSGGSRGSSYASGATGPPINYSSSTTGAAPGGSQSGTSASFTFNANGSISTHPKGGPYYLVNWCQKL